jgi:hypothetical protein
MHGIRVDGLGRMSEWYGIWSSQFKYYGKEEELLG